MRWQKVGQLDPRVARGSVTSDRSRLECPRLSGSLLIRGVSYSHQQGDQQQRGAPPSSPRQMFAPAALCRETAQTSPRFGKTHGQQTPVRAAGNHAHHNSQAPSPGLAPLLRVASSASVLRWWSRRSLTFTLIPLVSHQHVTDPQRIIIINT